MSRWVVKLEEELYRFLANEVQREGVFKSVESYVNFVLKELFLGEERKPMNDEETKLVERRLKDLGYL